MEVFPHNIACIEKEGFQVTQPVAERYLGGNSFTRFIQINCTIQISNSVDLETFGQWWNCSINGGADPFEITLGYYSSPKVVAVKFANDLKFTIIKDAYLMKATMIAQEAIHPPVSCLYFEPNYINSDYIQGE